MDSEFLEFIPAENKDHQPIFVEVSFSPVETQNNSKLVASSVKNPAAMRPHPRCLPRMFKTLSGCEVEITEIGLIHPKHDGVRTHFIFDVTDGVNDYRLSFNTETLEWFLEWEGDSNV